MRLQYVYIFLGMGQTAETCICCEEVRGCRRVITTAEDELRSEDKRTLEHCKLSTRGMKKREKVCRAMC